MNNQLKVYSCLIATLFIWSSDFILGKYLNTYLPPIYSSTLRFGIAVIALFILLLMRKEFIIPSLKNLVKLSLLGICGIGIFNPLVYVALQHTTSINSVMLNALNPSVTALLSFLLFKDMLSFKQFCYIGISIIGVALIALNGKSYQEFKFNIGDIMVLTNVTLWALYSIFGKRIMQELSPLQVTFYTCLSGFLFMAPFGIWQRSITIITSVPINVYVGILFMGILGSCFGMVFWYDAIMKLGTLKTSMLYNLIPLFATVQAILFYQEELQVYHIIGGIFIIGSSMMMLKHREHRIKVP